MTTEMTVNVEPSWIALAEVAISLIEQGGKGNGEEGRIMVRDMGKRLAQVRATQDNCPEHLKDGARWGPNRDT